MTTYPQTAKLPDRLLIEPLERPFRCAVRVPGSKSITNRALVLAALAGHAAGSAASSRLSGALFSEDTVVMVDCLQRLGFAVRCDPSQCVIEVAGAGGIIPRSKADLYVANSGTTMRFLTAMVSLGHGEYRLDGVPRMRERPIRDLLDALAQLGVDAASESGNGCPPVVVRAAGLNGGAVRMRGNISSQFLSGLLMAAPLANGDIRVQVDGPLVSWPYVAMTLDIMRQFGAAADATDRRTFHIPGAQHYQPQEYAIEPDASAASYFAGAAAVAQGEVTLPGLCRDSLQGDVRFVDVLAQMGCEVAWHPDGVTVRGRPLRGVDVDMNDISDTVMTLAVVACFAEGCTTIRNVGHIRHKETDRIAALAAELRKLGAGVEERSDGLTIHPGPLRGAEIETYNDHRMAMSFALAGLRVPGVTIRNPACVGKTYPTFFEDLARLR